MGHPQFLQLLLPLSISLFLISGSVVSTRRRSFTITNNCEITIWPAILSNADSPPILTTAFSLLKSQSKTLSAPSSWAGRFWARTHCSTDPNLSCLTGATPPATLAEFKLDGFAGQDFYDVSLVDGYNLPLLVTPQGAASVQNCTAIGCVLDLNGACPSDLRVMSAEGERVACNSACEAFKDPEYCCDGAYGSPDTCKPSKYSEVFKRACPRAYSYAYDDNSSTFTCTSPSNYLITFCPSTTTSQKSSSSSLGGQTTNSSSSSSSDSASSPTSPTTTTDSTSGGNNNSDADATPLIVYQGAMDFNGDDPYSSSPPPMCPLVGMVAITLLMLF